jgi:hypothetical protein
MDAALAQPLLADRRKVGCHLWYTHILLKLLLKWYVVCVQCHREQLPHAALGGGGRADAALAQQPFADRRKVG